ncbi:hypothetical protein [Wolbachia endosymbiont (group E) of Neria commutata]|uniref:hypothetical protein n=1 Tax=Wolbachia endosymbiont (group E) of Neria commutata TaxID=3066149 RepID=UPI003132AEC4
MIKELFNEWISQPFDKYISQPTANLYNKIMGKSGESDHAQVNADVNADFSADPHNIPPSGDNDVL